MWAMSSAIPVAAGNDDWTWPPGVNPLSEAYQTADGRWIALCCLQAGYYWPHVCAAIGRPELAEDPRFTGHKAILAHSAEASAILAEAFAERTLDEWTGRLAGFPGQWSPVQDAREAAADPQAAANGYLQPVVSAEGAQFSLVAAPVQYDGEPAAPARGPDYNEHGDEILAELGLDMDAILDLKIRGVIA
jgi:crotonobetainyl-CoA:carnitine CoA-transferase CaiB-like acyl-CoA transferase